MRILYPEVLPLLIAAFNVYGTVQTKQSEVQGLMQIHKMAKQMFLCGKNPDWQHIKNAILKSQPPFADDIDFMAQFVISRAGTSDKNNALLIFVAAIGIHVPASRRIPGPLFGALADFPMTNFAWAACLAAYTAEMEEKDKYKMSNFITAAEVKLLTKHLLKAKQSTETCAVVVNPDVQAAVVSEGKTVQACVAAEILLLQVRERLQKAGVTEEIHLSNKLNKCFTHLSTGLVRFVLGKPAWEGRDTTHLHAIGWRFLEDLKLVFPHADLPKISLTWPACEQACEASKEVSKAFPKAAPRSAPKPEVRFYDVDERGVVTDSLARLRAQNLDVGSVVGRRGEEGSFLTIVAVDPKSVRLEVLAGAAAASSSETPAGSASNQPAGTPKCVELTVFFTDYVAKNPKDMKVKHPGWPCEDNDDGDALYERAFLIYASAKVRQYCERSCGLPPIQVVDLFTKPSRMAVAKAACPIGGLFLAPLSVKVNSCKTEELHQNTWNKRCEVTRLVNKKKNEKMVFYLSELLTNERAGAYWFVEPTSDPKLVNMQPAIGTFTITGGVELTAPEKLEMLSRAAAEAAPEKAAAPAKAATAAKLAAKEKAAAPAKAGAPEPEAAAAEKAAAQAKRLPEDAVQEKGRVPILINSKPLAPGDVLYYFCKEERGQKRDREPEQLTVGKVMKARAMRGS